MAIHVLVGDDARVRSFARGSFGRAVRYGLCALQLMALVGCITGGASTPVNSESVTSNTGAYPEVLSARGGLGCTGTIVGPFTVITAGHCVGATNVVGYAGQTFAAPGAYLNPYRDRVPYAPAWWTTANAAQIAKGTRRCDWPAMHDQMILFVPTLTPAWLAQNGIVEFPNLDPSGRGDRLRIVGVGSTGVTARVWADAGLLASIPGSIETRPRDGYVNLDPTISMSNAGDSGGPLFLSSFFSSPTGVGVEAYRHLVGTNQDTLGSYAPVGYTSAMTANQRATARLNALWAIAQTDDADNDGLPSDCDSQPATAGGSNSCPNSVGVPTGAQAVSPAPPQQCTEATGLSAWIGTSPQPIGELKCRDGYVATGFRGHGGDLVDKLALRCSAISCFYGSGPCDSYETESFGGEGGSDYSEQCPAGQALTALEGFQDSSGLRSISPRCRPFENIRSLPPTETLTPLFIVGNRFGALTTGTAYQASCAKDRLLTGLVLRSADVRFVTGMQAICSVQPGGFSTYAGGKGGRGYELACPQSYLVAGSAQRRASDGVDHFALLCAPRTSFSGGASPSNAVIVATNGTYRDASSGLFPYKTWPYAAYAAARPTDASEVRCPAGQAVFGAAFHTDRFVNGVPALLCRSVDSGGVTSTIQTGVNSPGNVGFLSVQECSDGGFVDGAFVRSGDRLDGVAVHCDRHNRPDSTFRLDVTRTGLGVVASSAVGIDCGATCHRQVRYGTSVTLGAKPMPGWAFAGWSGSCGGTGNCHLTMSSDRSVVATFTELAPQASRITVTLLEPTSCTGAALGTVTVTPPGLICNTGSPAGACSASVAPGTSVTLSASVGDSTSFGGYTGACSSASENCTLTVNGSVGVTATFCGLIR